MKTLSRLIIESIPLGIFVLGSMAQARSENLSLSVAEMSILQQRLTDEACYSGPINGQDNAAMRKALAVCPKQLPQLRIETGMHVAAIRSISLDQSCRLLATASDDKTVRLWALPGMRLEKTLRVPIDAGNGGKQAAVALSPNGSLAATGGWDSSIGSLGVGSITVFDSGSGVVVKRVGLFHSTITGLAFSADGSLLAASLGGTAGIRVYKTSNWVEASSDVTFRREVSGFAFSKTNALYVITRDGVIRRYGGTSFRKNIEVFTGSYLPTSISVNNEENQIIVGNNDTGLITIYDADTLRRLKDADLGSASEGIFYRATWGSHGRSFIAGGAYFESGNNVILMFDKKGKLSQKIALPISSISDIKSCGATFVISTIDGSVAFIPSDGAKKLIRKSVAPDMEGIASGATAKEENRALLVSPDAKKVHFGLDGDDQTGLTFSLMQRVAQEGGNTKGFLLARTKGTGIAGWDGDFDVTLKGRRLSIDDDAKVTNDDVRSRSLAMRTEADGFVLGTDKSLRSFDESGRIRWHQRGPGAAWGVNLSADGRIVVVAYSDGTIRWHRWSDGQELLAFFFNRQTKTWVAYTPSGYYMASPGGEDLIGWQVNRGWAQAADFFPASKFHNQFARPDIVEKILDTLDEGEAVRQANVARAGQKLAPVPVLEQLPPVISIMSPPDGSRVGDEVRLEYLVRSPSNLPVDSVEALIDGRPVSDKRGLRRVDEDGELEQCLGQTRGLGRLDGLEQGCRGSLNLSLPADAREVGLFARSGRETSKVASIRLTRMVPASGIELMKPKLYALVVGISTYGNPDYTLTYPAKDARDFAAALTNQTGGLYSDVKIRTLADAQATTIAIKDGLDWLTKEVTSRDVGVVYLAGHGALDERDRFYFLAADSDGSRLRSTAVPREDIADALYALSGQALLFLDACHAGAMAPGGVRRSAVDINSLVNDFARSEHGVVVFAASTGRQVSQESAAWNNGAFTKALVEGLGIAGSKAKADLIGGGTITTSELDAYVANRVKALTSGTQSPVMIRPANVPDFPFALAR